MRPARRLASTPRIGAAPPMSSLPPLTHHDIVELVEPFVRRGRQPDLAASDRAARRVSFVRVGHEPEPAADGRTLPAREETLELDAADAPTLRLTRTLTTGAGLQATLTAEGEDAAELLHRIEGIPAARQFLLGPAGAIAALRQRSTPGSSSAKAPVAVAVATTASLGDAPPLVLTGAQARVAGLEVHVKVSGVAGFPAELELRRGDRDTAGAADGGATPRQLPEDLLAVLGRSWDRLTPVRAGWLGSVELRGAEPHRSRDAEAKLRLTLDHLARTLAEPPARFHERHAAARWLFALRGSLPLAVGAALVGTALVVQRLGDEYSSVLALLANLAPPLLMGLFFLRREMPRIGLPRPPRRLPASAWVPSDR